MTSFPVEDSAATVRDALEASGVFGGLAPMLLTRLARQFERVAVPGGTVLITQGEPGDAMWLVVNGRLGVFDGGPTGAGPAGAGPAGPGAARAGADRPGEAGGGPAAPGMDGAGTDTSTTRETMIGEVGRGQVVGEWALLSDRPRSATVRALRDTDLVRLPATSFRRLVTSNPEILIALSATLIGRSVRPATAAPPRPAAATIAVLPVGDIDRLRVTEFCRRLTHALGAAAHVRAADIDRAVGRSASRSRPGQAAHGAVVQRLQAVEEDHDHVVYQGDGRDSAWTERCVRQADRVVLLGDGTSGPPDTLPRMLRSLPAPPELALLHRDFPRRTGAWLDRVGPRAHHHIRPDDDCGRLARILTGRAVGLVLGGGGARGLAHLGVMRALEETGIPIDSIGGTSIGAVMAAAYAMGWDDPTRVQHVTATFLRKRFLLAPTFPATSATSSRTITRLMRDPAYLGEVAIEDMWTPYYAVATSLTRGDIVVRDRGPAWRAVRASIAIPGVLPPVWDGDDVLVDGGVLDDLPVDVMRARLDGHVIAVDLRPPPDARVGRAFEPTVSGWRMLGRWLVRRADVLTTLDVLRRSKDVGVRRAQRDRCGPVDLYLQPPTEGHGSFDFRGAGSLIQAGYEYAAARLEEEVVAWSS